jgi:predicted phosphodiesterase
MRYALVSDVHGNLEALKSVIGHMENEGVDKSVCLGDIVGLGPQPNECINTIVEKFNFIIAGEFDNAVINPPYISSLTPIEKESAEWTRNKINESSKTILKNIEIGYMTGDNIMFVHGSPHGHYVSVKTDNDALNAFANPMEEYNIAFIGKTHIPCVWEHDNNCVKMVRPRFDSSDTSSWSYNLSNNIKTIINIGSVGQSKDGDKRACYVIYDTSENTVTYHRIPYPVDRTIAKMQQNGFPTDLIARLMYGK